MMHTFRWLAWREETIKEFRMNQEAIENYYCGKVEFISYQTDNAYDLELLYTCIVKNLI